MNRQQFNQALEKLRQAPCKAEVLRLVLAGHTNAEIARLRDRAEGTVRKQISQIYQDFAITSEFPGDQALRDKLKALFREYKPEWISDCHSAVTNEVSEEQERLNPNSLPHLVSSSAKRGESLRPLAARMLHQFDFYSQLLSSTRSVEGEEDLMYLATKMLKQLGFDQKFKVNRTSQYIGYRFKNYKRYHLLLSQRKEDLCISISQDVLKSEVLELRCLTSCGFTDDGDLDYEQYILCRCWVLPSKEDVFLESMQSKYPNCLKGEVTGCFLLNDYDDEVGEWISMSPNEFNLEDLDETGSYLIVNENQLFPYTWQVCINSTEVLQEFIAHFGEILSVDFESF